MEFSLLEVAGAKSTYFDLVSLDSFVIIILHHRDFMSFGSGDLYLNSASSLMAVTSITLTQVTSLTAVYADSSTASVSCSEQSGHGKNGTNIGINTKASIVKTITGDYPLSSPFLSCKSGSDTSDWTFSKCGSYLPSVAATSAGSKSMITINPCQTECGQTAAVDGITLLVVDFVQKKPAPAIKSITFGISKSEVVANIIMSDAGSVYCSVYPVSYVPPSVDLVVMGGNVATTSEVDMRDVARVTISNLQASSNYSFFCVSHSVEGVRAKYSDMINTRRVVSTPCCKSIVAQLLVTSFAQGVPEQSALRLSLDSPLTSDTTVYLDVASATTGSTSTSLISPFFPKTVVFKAGVVKSTVVSFQAGVGRYNLKFTVVPSTEVEIAYPRGQLNNVTVVEADQKIPPPQFLSAEFSQTGASLTVKFTAPTNKMQLPSSFTCNLLLRFTGSLTY